eukprot:2689737-Alexandrium_andersonii.AAC.1
MGAIKDLQSRADALEKKFQINKPSEKDEFHQALERIAAVEASVAAARSSGASGSQAPNNAWASNDRTKKRA